MAHPTIIDAERVHKATLVATDAITLPATFPVFAKDGVTDDADLLVILDGVEKPNSEWSFEGTFADGISAGGTVRLDAAVSATAYVYGDIAARRTVDFSEGNVRTAALNTELDRLWACLREVQHGLKRSFKIPIPEADSDETVVDQVAPALATRAGMGMAFDANGRPTVGTATALNAIAAALNDLVNGAADKGVYWTDTDTAALFDLSPVARTLLAQTTQALMRTTGLGMSANGSSLVSAANYAAMLTLLGIGTATESAEGLTEQATDAEIRSAASGAKAIMAEDMETAAAGVALTDASPVAVNWDSGINFTLTVTTDRQIDNPTNGQPGTYRTILIQGNDGTARTITFDTEFLGDVPTITDCTSTKWYLLTIYCVSSSHFVASAKVAKS